MGKGIKKYTANLKAESRRAKALELKKSGLSYRQIAELGKKEEWGSPAYSSALAYKDVQDELNKLAEHTLEVATEYRVLEDARLDKLLTALASSIAKGDTSAVNTAIRISESRRRLWGVDAPTKIAPTTPDGSESAPMLPSEIVVRLVKPDGS